ncbi:DUF3265 domain-containing protein [Vibrio vulnificus]|nr:DUF3265 domain-containing protein [Vibrio vulnificus]
MDNHRTNTSGRRQCDHRSSNRCCRQHLWQQHAGIHAAWHFWFAVSFGGEGGLQKLDLCGTHPLTQRYMPVIRMICSSKTGHHIKRHFAVQS